MKVPEGEKDKMYTMYRSKSVRGDDKADEALSVHCSPIASEDGDREEVFKPFNWLGVLVTVNITLANLDKLEGEVETIKL